LPNLRSHCPGRHRHLHSFPTRRSSDLFLAAFKAEKGLQQVLGQADPLAQGTRLPAQCQSLAQLAEKFAQGSHQMGLATLDAPIGDRKSTRLNSSHVKISYAVFCLKKKT